MSMRRSLNFLENKDIVSLEDQVKCSEFYYDSMIFDYKLNDKAAKSKLVKGAKRAVFQLEENSTSINQSLMLVLGRLVFFHLSISGVRSRVIKPAKLETLLSKLEE